MRPNPTRKIRDEGLRGASKMMNDNLSVFGKIVEIVRPLLHHAPALGQVLRVIVGGADLVAFAWASWRSIQSGWNPISFRRVEATARKAMDSGAAVKSHPIH